jgi:hypothetical protein
MLNNLKDEILNGGIAGLISVLFYQPFQVIRTNMMVTYDHGKNPNMLFMTKRILSEEGPIGFYRGFVPAMIKTTVGTAIYFGTLDMTKNFMEKHTTKKSHKTNFIASGFARFVQTVLNNPIMVIKTRFEVVGFNSYSSVFEAVRKIKQEEGIRGFFQGLKQGIVKDVPASALFYCLYEGFKYELIKMHVTSVQQQAIVSSLCATVIITLITNPLDVIRTRILFLHISQNKNHDYKGIISGIMQLTRQEGVRGLLAGIAPKFVKKCVSGITVWTSYESLKENSNKIKNKLNVL